MKSYDERFAEALQQHNQNSDNALKQQIMILQEAVREASQAASWDEARKILSDVPYGVSLPQTPKKAQGR
jgi:hypothetical protein